MYFKDFCVYIVIYYLLYVIFGKNAEKIIFFQLFFLVLAGIPTINEFLIGFLVKLP